MTRREKAYERKAGDLIEKVNRLTDAEVARVLAILEQARAEVVGALAATEWTIYRQAEYRAMVDRAVASFEQGFAANQERALPNVWSAGIDMVDAPLAEAGFQAAAAEISRAQLAIMQADTLDLIKGLSADAKKLINGAISQGLLGSKPLTEVMRGIGQELRAQGTVGSKVSWRAEAITRTEMGKINSWARQARIRQTIDANPDIKWRKKWIHSGKLHARANHSSFNGTTLPLERDWPGHIPYPHAPGLPAAEVVMCGCVHLLVADWKALPKAFSSRTYQDRAIYD